MTARGTRRRSASLFTGAGLSPAMSDREEFLAGDRPEDVFMYFADDAVSGIDALAGHGERVDDGVVLVVEGDSGRSAFQRDEDDNPMLHPVLARAIRNGTDE